MAEAIAALYERDLDAVGARRGRACCGSSPGTVPFTAQMATYASLLGARRHAVSGAAILGLRSPTS